MSFADFSRLSDPAAPPSTSASAWLKEQLAAADATPADQIEGATALAQEVPPGLAGRLAGADTDPAFSFAGPGDAHAAQALAGQLCRRCALQTRCPEEACRIFRVERQAIDYISDNDTAL